MNFNTPPIRLESASEQPAGVPGYVWALYRIEEQKEVEIGIGQIAVCRSSKNLVYRVENNGYGLNIVSTQPIGVKPKGEFEVLAFQYGVRTGEVLPP